MDAKAEPFLRNLIDDALAELDNIFLKGFVACWVIEHFADDASVARTEDIMFRDADKVSDSKTGHNRIV